MPEKKRSTDYIEFTTYILESSLDKFNNCLDKIEMLVHKAESIPPDLIDEYFGFFYFKEDEEWWNLGEKLTRTIEETIVYFSKDKPYQFKGIEEQKYGSTFKFDVCIRTILTGYNLNILNKFSLPKKNLVDFETRKRLLNYFFDSLGRFSEPYDKPGKPLFSFYQKVVMAAFIVQKLGFKVTSRRFTKKQLFDAVKHSIIKTESL